MPARRNTRRPRTAALFVSGTALSRSKPAKEHRVAFLPKNMKYRDQDGDLHGPFTIDYWIYEDADANVDTETCVKDLVSDYIPDEYHSKELLLQLADAYRAATNGK